MPIYSVKGLLSHLWCCKKYEKKFKNLDYLCYMNNNKDTGVYYITVDYGFFFLLLLLFFLMKEFVKLIDINLTSKNN